MSTLPQLPGKAVAASAAVKERLTYAAQHDDDLHQRSVWAIKACRVGSSKWLCLSGFLVAALGACAAGGGDGGGETHHWHNTNDVEPVVADAIVSTDVLCARPAMAKRLDAADNFARRLRLQRSPSHATVRCSGSCVTTSASAPTCQPPRGEKKRQCVDSFCSPAHDPLKARRHRRALTLTCMHVFSRLRAIPVPSAGTVVGVFREATLHALHRGG